MITKIQTKITLLLLLIIGLLMIGLIILWQSERNRADLLFRNREQEKQKSFDKLLQLSQSSMEAFAFNYTYYDELYDFISTRDQDWAYQNIEVALPDFNTQAAWVYTLDRSLIYSINNVEDNSLKQLPLPQEGFEALFTDRFIHFFYETSKGIMEIRGATIHRSFDNPRRESPQGYFFVGRLWSKEYLDELSELTESTVRILPLTQEVPASDRESGTIVFSKLLPGWDGAPLARLYAQSESAMIKDLNYLSNRNLLLFIIFSLTIITLLTVTLVRWLSMPLQLLSKSLNTGDPNIIHNLQKEKNEFGQLAQLINQFFAQRADLMKEIANRMQTEEALESSRHELEKRVEDRTAELTKANAILKKHISERQRVNQQLTQLTKEMEEVGRILVRRDLELTQANERLQELDRIKSEFVSVAAHQLRTPLTGIKWAMHSLLSEDLGTVNDNQRRIVGDAFQATLRMVELINDLLNIARLEEGRFGFSFKAQSIVSLLENVIARFQSMAKEKRIRLALDTSNGADIPNLKFDEEKIALVIENLLDNAVKYTPPDGSVTVRLKKTEEGVAIEVEDTGIGIPAEEAHRVFQKFFRAKNAQLFQTSGTGLGLYLAKNIIERHGGTIAINSTEGKGTLVSLTLPFTV